jgi:hypothetical protein
LVIATSTGDTGLAHTARVAFAEAMSSSFVVAAVAVLGSAVLAFVLLRDRSPVAPADLSSDDDAVIAAH